MIKLCDGDCNHCPLINHPNADMLSVVLNELHNQLGNEVYKIVQSFCPNFTVCSECRVDDFTHVEGCGIVSYSCDKLRQDGYGGESGHATERAGPSCGSNCPCKS